MISWSLMSAVIAVQIETAEANINVFDKHTSKLTALWAGSPLILPATHFIEVWSEHCKRVLPCFSV
jgi:hypothetical protein